jgi:hypothetical protein
VTASVSLYAINADLKKNPLSSTDAAFRVFCDRMTTLGLLVSPTSVAEYTAQLYLGGRTTLSTFKVGG